MFRLSIKDNQLSKLFKYSRVHIPDNQLSKGKNLDTIS